MEINGSWHSNEVLAIDTDLLFTQNTHPNEFSPIVALYPALNKRSNPHPDTGLSLKHKIISLVSACRTAKLVVVTEQVYLSSHM